MTVPSVLVLLLEVRGGVCTVGTGTIGTPEVKHQVSRVFQVSSLVLAVTSYACAGFILSESFNFKTENFLVVHRGSGQWTCMT